MVNKLLDFLIGPTKTETPATEPSPGPKLKSNPPPTLEESQDNLKLALEKVKEASQQRVLCYEAASEIFADEDLQKALIEVEIDADSSEEEEDL